MKRLAALVLALLLTAVLSLYPAPARAETGCLINLLGIKVCGTLIGQPLPEVVTVTVRPDPIRIPGPTSTVTVTPAPQVKEVRVPGPTTFVTDPVPGPTVTRTPQAVPTQTVTAPVETVTVTPDPRQEPEGRDKIDNEEDSGFFSDEVDPGDGETTVAEVGIGTLTLLALVGLLLFTLYAGYIMGYRDREAKDTNFIRAVLDSSKISRGQHS